MGYEFKIVTIGKKLIMTLCVAVKVPIKDKKLLPRKRSIAFSEPGIIIAADTRFSWDNAQVNDRGIKIWPLSNQAIAGFSTNNVEFAEAALFATRINIQKLNFQNHEKIALATRNHLRYYKECLGCDRKLDPTTVLLGIYDTRIKHFFLYLLSDKDNFEPNPREGMCAIGSGKAEFETIFFEEFKFKTKKWADQVKAGKIEQRGDMVVWVEPRPGDRKEVPLMVVANVVIYTLDVVLESTNIATVGGSVQNFILSTTGLNSPRGTKRSSDGKWIPITAKDLRSYSKIGAKTYEIPKMRNDCSIE